MTDRLEVRETGADKTFGDIAANWTGVTSAAAVTGQGGYRPGYLYRDMTLTFGEGSEVYLLESPDGEVFIMQSFTRHQDPGLSEDELAHLGRRLDLPGGWGFRAETLDQDLEVSPNPDKLAHVLHDDLHNVYQGSDLGRAFTRFCQPYGRW
jgi:hypothetical protein